MAGFVRKKAEKMAAMCFEQVQRFILAQKKYFQLRVTLKGFDGRAVT